MLRLCDFDYRFDCRVYLGLKVYIDYMVSLWYMVYLWYMVMVLPNVNLLKKTPTPRGLYPRFDPEKHLSIP